MVEWNTRSATEKSSDRVTVWGALSALALGALLGCIGVLCSRWVNDSPLLSTALRSAFSTMALAVMASGRLQDLILGNQNLHTCSRTGHRGTTGRETFAGRGWTPNLGFRRRERTV